MPIVLTGAVPIPGGAAESPPPPQRADEVLLKVQVTDPEGQPATAGHIDVRAVLPGGGSPSRLDLHQLQAARRHIDLTPDMAGYAELRLPAMTVLTAGALYEISTYAADGGASDTRTVVLDGLADELWLDEAAGESVGLVAPSEAAALQSQITTLTAATADLQAQIDTLILTGGGVTQAQLDAAVGAEATARQNADTAETSARQAGDAAEVTARDAAVAVETSARQAAVTGEAAARQAAVDTLTTDLLAEASSRLAADDALQAAVDAAVLRTLLDARGDLFVATAADTPARLPAPDLTAEVTLVPDSAAATGLAWGQYRERGL